MNIFLRKGYATGSYKLLRKHKCFIHGNGVCTLKKPQIIDGERRCHGLVIHSRETYNRLYERIKKAFVRKKAVTLMVMEKASHCVFQH